MIISLHHNAVGNRFPEYRGESSKNLLWLIYSAVQKNGAPEFFPLQSFFMFYFMFYVHSKLFFVAQWPLGAIWPLTLAPLGGGQNLPPCLSPKLLVRLQRDMHNLKELDQTVLNHTFVMRYDVSCEV